MVAGTRYGKRFTWASEGRWLRGAFAVSYFLAIKP
jgi:hypothetical protein